MLQIFLNELDLERCSCLKQVFCSGEALSKELTNKFFAQLECDLHNLYGPTEAAIDVTCWQCQADSKLSTVAIGKPISNTQIYILDQYLEPLPIAVAGEIYIGGDGLARGYLNRPELTKKRFIANPFGTGRLYKTGDLACYLPDGNIEYLGRIDNQVKIRGFRIELGEIELVLNSHPQVNQAIAIVKEDKVGHKLLVAYVAVNESLSNRELRKYASSKLPEYMVPNTVFPMETLPLTPNGKVDRKAISAIEVDIVSPKEYAVPRTLKEELLAKIWSEILDIETVGIYDNFFELGGHSLIAVSLMSQIQQEFQKNIPLAALFESPTIEKLALVIDSESSTKQWSALVPIQEGGLLTPIFCVPGVGGNVLYFHHLSRYLGKNQPLYGLQAQGLDGHTKPLESIEAIACQYIEAIKTVQLTGPYLLLEPLDLSLNNRIIWQIGIMGNGSIELLKISKSSWEKIYKYLLIF